MPNPFIAEALLRARRPTFELGVDVTREQEEEEKLYQEQQRARERRSRKYESASGKGRWVGAAAGGLLGFLVGGPLGAAKGAKIGLTVGAGVGSYLGQKIATDPRISPGVKLPEKFKRISAGRYYVDIGEEQQKQFEFEETERTRYLNEQILTRAAMDAMTAYGVTKYGGGILDMILGRGTGGGVTFPGGSIEQSLIQALGRT